MASRAARDGARRSRASSETSQRRHRGSDEVRIMRRHDDRRVEAARGNKRSRGRALQLSLLLCLEGGNSREP